MSVVRVVAATEKFFFYVSGCNGRSFRETCTFLPRDAMRKRGLCCRPMSLCLSVCLSVRLSVKLVHCIQTAEDIVKLRSRPGSPIILVFLTLSADTQFQGNSFSGDANT